MRSGKLKERVTIQKAVETRRAAGGVVERWEDVATVWAAVIPLSGREFFGSAQRNASVSHRIEIRSRTGLVPKMRAVFKGRTFNITAVLNVEERDREMHLMCEELVGRSEAA